MTDRSANSTEPLLRVRHLTTEFVSADAPPARAVEDVSFDVYPGQTLGLVGESGCGKTTTMLSIMRLLPSAGRITQGEVLFDDIDLLRITERQMRHYRWKEMAMVFQGAMNALNPVRTVGDQIAEAILLHEPIGREAADRRVIDLLDMVGIAKSRKEQYPHQYSGGMRQRAMIAMALACRPRLLFADEPTTALDVMIQAQILELLEKIQRELGLAIVLVTHDLGVVAEIVRDGGGDVRRPGGGIRADRCGVQRAAASVHAALAGSLSRSQSAGRSTDVHSRLSPALERTAAGLSLRAALSREDRSVCASVAPKLIVVDAQDKSSAFNYSPSCRLPPAFRSRGE